MKHLYFILFKNKIKCIYELKLTVCRITVAEELLLLFKSILKFKILTFHF